MAFDKKKIIPRYMFIISMMALVAVCIVLKTAKIMFTERAFWSEVAQTLIRSNVPVPATRGNIISADGMVVASTLPEYKIFLDFMSSEKDSLRRAREQHRRDSLLYANLDSLCYGLNKICPDWSAKRFKQRIEEGRKRKSRNWQIYPKRITFSQYQETKELPYLRLGANRSGYHATSFKLRKKPFGSLASRSIGDVYAELDSAKCGLELSFDSILRGKPGISYRKKVRDRWVAFVEKEPEHGCDIVTTIDMGMQDIAEKALVNKLQEIGAKVGVVVLMEVATGEVKAIVNMTRCADGKYYEIRNNAVSDMMEPGSTFKTASMLVALNDGHIELTDSLNTGNGIYPMHGRFMKDHNWRRGGYQWLTVPEILMFSSNIGISRIIDENYRDDPARFVEGLYKTGIATALDVPFAGAAKPWVRKPTRNPQRKTEWLNWSKTALPWMSIGYETQIPPINTVAFYNAIANGGKMVSPKFVRSIIKEGKVVKEFPTEVLHEEICTPEALRKIQTMLEMVVSDGLGKKAGNSKFAAAGKTGTAQISQGAGGYTSGTINYLISFCGYFPAENPQYSCIVAIQKSGLPASGGGHCGPVFSEISQGVMAKHEAITRSWEEAKDTINQTTPIVKRGSVAAASKVLGDLKMISKPSRYAQSEWGAVEISQQDLEIKPLTTKENAVPNVSGMGAKDAIYLLESQGFKVRVNGIGTVSSQSVPAGRSAKKGTTIQLHLI